MTGRPDNSEYAAYFAKYVDLVPGTDPRAALSSQLQDSTALFQQISEEKSLFRYAPGKWSIRQLLNHVTDTERAFAYRALWISRGFNEPLISYDQDTAAAGAEADRIPWSAHVEEFRAVRLATIQLFANMPPTGWMRSGIVSNNPFTARSLAFIAAGHVTHHLNVLKERYFNP